MKKILAILAVLVFVPFSAYALQMIHDDAMDEITGQAGVTVETDLTISVALGSVAWLDSDGVGTFNGTMNSLVGLMLNPMTIGAITVDTTTYGAGIAIDVGSDTTGVYYGGTPFLRVGITTLDVAVGSVATNFAGNIDVAGIVMTAIGGYVDVGAAFATTGNPTGLSITLGPITVGNFAMGIASWTDLDGVMLADRGAAGADDNPGAIGILGMSLGNLAIAGNITIECGTDALGRPAGSGTFLDITLNGLAITSTSPLSITIALGTSPATLTEIMGTLVTSPAGMNIGVSGNVQISAH